jgi:flavin-dependent dehydrogenase
MSPTLILGGGPAGCAAAITLARAGHPVCLIERDAEVREKVCGEFLGGDAQALLARLGLDAAALGGVPITEGRLGAGRREAGFALPFTALGLPRLILDAALLEAAEQAGAEVRRGVTALEAAPGWRVRLSDGQELQAARLMLATGKHELRGLGRGQRGGALGLKLPVSGVETGGAVLLLACAGGYAGLQPRPDGGANLCAALDPAMAPVARDAEAFLEHVRGGSTLARRVLAGAVPSLARPLAVAGVPYGYRHRGGGPQGLFRLGDQAAVIPSLCGDGIAMALDSGIRAAEAILAGREAGQGAAWAARVAGPMRLAGGIAALIGRAPGLLVAGVGLAPGLARHAAGRMRVI